MAAAPLQLHLRGELVDFTFRRVLPLQVPVPLADVYLTELLYCGNVDGSGRLIGVAIASITTVIQDAVVRRYASCTETLASIASNASAGTQGQPDALAFDLRPGWSPWEITLAVHDAAVAGPNAGLLDPEVMKLKTTGTALAQIPVDNVRFDIGADQPLEYRVAARFAADGIHLAMVPAADAAMVPTTSDLQTIGSDQDAPRFTNVILSVDPTHVNEVLDSRFKKTSIPVPLPLASNAKLHIADLDLEATPDNLLSRFQIYTNNPNETLPLAITWTGTDLAADRAEVPIPPNDCAGKPLPQRPLCNATYNLKRTLANVIATAITAEFKAKALRPLRADQRLRINLGGGEGAVSVVVTRSAALNGRVVLYANTSFED